MILGDCRQLFAPTCKSTNSKSLVLVISEFEPRVTAATLKVSSVLWRKRNDAFCLRLVPALHSEPSRKIS